MLRFIPKSLKYLVLDNNFPRGKGDVAKAISTMIGENNSLKYLSIKGEKSTRLGKYAIDIFGIN